MGSKFVVLVALSNCTTIMATFSNAFFGKRQHFFENLKIELLPTITNTYTTYLNSIEIGW